MAHSFDTELGENIEYSFMRLTGQETFPHSLMDLYLMKTFATVE